MVGSITRLMITQHSLINRKLQYFINTPEKQIKKLRKIFSDFKWNLQKHMFNEETNIFTIINHKDKIEVNQVKELLKDHQEITFILDKISPLILSKKELNAKTLLKKLVNHEQKEIKILYPKLDERLSSEQKKEVLAYSNEIKII